MRDRVIHAVHTHTHRNQKVKGVIFAVRVVPKIVVLGDSHV